MRLGILGPVVMQVESRSLPVGSGRERLVLAMLLMGADRLVPADRLIDALWHEPPASARAQLHNMIRNLRQRIRGVADDLIVTRPLGYELRLGDHEFDLAEFRHRVERGLHAAREGDHAGAFTTLDDALALWRGPALADVTGELTARLRESLQGERLRAYEVMLDSRLRAGDPNDVVTVVRELIAEQPYREYLYEIEMRALAHAGRRSEALEAYQVAYRRLADDLGVEPGSALQQLEREILQGTSVAPGPPARQVPRELPAPVSALVGRSAMLDEICDEFKRLADRGPGESPHLGLLTGPGGIGKTALAVAAGHRLGDAFPDGTLFADLGGTALNSHQMLGRFLRSLGVDGARIPQDPDERVARYRSRVASSRVLVVLDDAASEEQVRPLLPSGSGCAVLVTSRRTLTALLPATRWPVPLLEPGDTLDLLATILGDERVSHERAAATEVARLCGHLPLAVCVAGARVAAHPQLRITDLRRRLADERGRLDELSVGDIDVRATIAWTYQSLNPSQQRLFRRLGLIQAPDWPAWVMLELLGDAGFPARTLRLVDELIDVHLVEPIGRDAVGQTRFRMHDLITRFAAERALDEESAQDRADALDRVLSGWLALATVADEGVGHGRQLAVGLTAPEPPAEPAVLAHDAPAAWFETERMNLSAAIDQACGLGEFELAGRLALRCSGFLTVRAYDDDRERLLRGALAAVPAGVSPDLRVRLLGGLFTVCAQRARFVELPALAAERLEAARLLGDRELEQGALIQAGWAARRLARFDEAKRWLEEASAVETGPGKAEQQRAEINGELGAICVESGDPRRGEPLLAELVAATRVAGAQTRQLVVCLLAHAESLTELARYADSRFALAEAQQICRSLGDDLGLAYTEVHLADIDVRTGALQDAAERLARATPVLDQHTQLDANPDGLRVLGDLATAEERWADASDLLRGSAEIWLQVRNPLEAARSLGRLERALTGAGDEAAATECRTEYEQIIGDLGLDEACLRLPPQG